MVQSMFRALVERGHDVSVWLSRYTDDKTDYELDGVKVVPLQSRLDAGTAIRQADVVVSHLENVPSAGALARGYGKPLAVVCHNTHAQSFREMAGGCDLAVYNSQWMKREAELFFAEYPKGVRPRSEAIVRPPVFADEYRTKPGTKVTLVNLNAEKGGALFEKLARRMPDVEFLAVVGAYGEQIVPDLPNVEVIDHMCGHEMRDAVYARTRILLMPSSYESWGRAGVEAMASGIPVIAHPTPGLCESLGEAGVFIDLHDVDGYEMAIRKLLDSKTEYGLVAKRAKARSAELDPTPDLAAWCTAVEALA
ncbi:glycosyltransferase family 4 protein [Streptomyces sp. H27-H5]|uniref:glycosyltransferase family 4 protein n=1 Tax=Streptomyces sp. H27-H5 TaxID=2996460 RepID=UPI00226F9923|nr:glycosyltransferase family 4 protein [Streptomyces sp. H27-H5]MCY0962604.1 glycosyltransferase family 4 protein [Streptomyces sp. H27-H5]